jgi:type VI secretion system secreted protein VgrG
LTSPASASSLFSLQGGIKAIAANGPVSVQAHTGALEILADQAITITSVNNRIDLKANSQITLQAGQTTITLNGGNITFTCPGQFSAKGGQHPFSGGSSQAAQLSVRPNGIVPSKICIPCLLKAAAAGSALTPRN